MEGEVYKRKVDIRDELLSAAARRSTQTNCCLLLPADQLRRTTRDLRTLMAKCTEEDGWIFKTFIVNCDQFVIS